MEPKFVKQLNEENKEYEAEYEKHDMGAKPNLLEHDHFFRNVGGSRAECSCGWGLFVEPTELRDGHIYSEGKVVI